MRILTVVLVALILAACGGRPSPARPQPTDQCDTDTPPVWCPNYPQE